MTLVEAGFQPREQEFPLDTVEGGWVRLRRMNHGESNELAGLRVAFQIRGNDGEDEDDPRSASARTTIKLSRHYSFARVILDHNLGAKGKQLDFKKRRDVDNLDPVIGDEIANLIDKHNETLEDSVDIPNSNEG
jgi:hypothetical protein